MTNTAPITLRQLFTYYRGLPHQTAAIEELEQAFQQPGATYASVMNRSRDWFQTWSQAGKQPDTSRTEWATLVQALNLSQPDARTCQSTCLAMATGNRDIWAIRRRLEAMGDPGDPAVMSRYVRGLKPPVPYEYTANACLEDVYTWLKAGEFLITHGWFTNSGHVICLDGLRANTDGSESISVKDPWSEFDAASWSYPHTSRFYDGYYSDRCIYAACVAGASMTDAARLYRQGAAVDTRRGGMWVHRFRP